MIYMFDIDGTLTEPRQKMSEQFEKMFSKWMKKKKVFLVTGSDIAKVREQVPQHILDKCSGVFTCMGNELYLDNKLALSADIQIPGQLKGWLEQQVEFSDCPTKTSNHLEWRTGMLNFSVVGRAATNEQRKEYCRWDKISGERNRIANFIKNKYPEHEFYSLAAYLIEGLPRKQKLLLDQVNELKNANYDINLVYMKNQELKLEDASL